MALRVLFICDQYPPVLWDGAGTYASVLARALARLGHDVHVLCAQGRRFENVIDQGVHVYRRPLLRIPVTRFLGSLGRRLAGRYYPRDSITLRLSLALSYSFWMRRLNLRPDVIESHDGGVRCLFQAMRRSRPIVLTMQGPMVQAIRQAGEPLDFKCRVVDRLDRVGSDLADGITAPSQLIVDSLREGGWLRNREVDITPNPFDPSGWRLAAPVIDTEPVVATVGRLEAPKGTDVLLEASSRLLRAGVQHKLVLAGTPSGWIEGTPAGRWLVERARELGLDCSFPGHLPVEQLADVYAQARVVAVPSRFESFSYVGAEAMAGGRPVVATNTTGIAEYVGRWSAGAVVPPGDPSALAQALAPFLVDAGRAAAAGKNGEAGVAELDPIVVARRREAVYQRAIESFRARRHAAPIAPPASQHGD